MSQKEAKQKKEKRSTTITECSGVQGLKNYLDFNNHIDASYIAEGDREPCWDGHLYLYPSEEHKKDEMIGVIPVQIKGMKVMTFPEKFKYNIKIADLKQYLKRPTVFIVSLINEEKKSRQIWYRKLLPVTIKHILQGKDKQESVYVKMSKAPDSNKDFEDEMIVFVSDSIKQMSFGGVFLTKEQAKARNIKEVSFTLPRKMDSFQSLVYLSKTPNYPYANIDLELGVKLPVTDEPVTISSTKIIRESVSVNGTVFFKEFQSNIKDGVAFLTIGDFFTLTLYKYGEKINPQLKIHCSSPSLKSRLKQGEFLMALFDNDTLEIGEFKYDLNLTSNNVNVEAVKSSYQTMRKIQMLLDYLHVSKDLDMSKVNDKQMSDCCLLIKTLVDKEEISGSVKNQILTLDIGNIHLLLTSYEQKGKVVLQDFFETNIELGVKLEDGSFVSLPNYSYLSVDNLWKNCDNINFNKLVNEYKRKIAENEIVSERAIIDCEEMLKAAKSLIAIDSEKCLKICNAVIELSDLLKDKDKPERQHCHLLDKCIALKISGRNFDEFKKELLGYIANENVDNLYKACACLLLQDKGNHEKWLNLCSEDEKKSLPQDAFDIYK